MAKRPTRHPGPGAPPVRPFPAVAVVVSRYNATVTGAMLRGALAEYAARGGSASGAEVFDAPGAYELPTIALAAARSGRFEGVVALGCIIKGETSHDRYIAHAVADGLMSVALSTGVPVGFGVLTVDTVEQAEARAGLGGAAMGNKGNEAMGAVLDTIGAIALANTGSRGETEAPGGLMDGRLRPDKARRGGAKPAGPGQRF